MSKKKKIMLLGGIHYLLPVIEAAHKQGYYVITADYLPENVAHKYSDEFVNVSIVDKEAVLKEAIAHNIDGIISFGVDPGVISAAYVQEKMGLPSMGPYESVKILQNKDLFRAFLTEHNFNVPRSKGYTCKEDALKDTDWLKFPMIVKPTDSAGSKGVTRVDRIEDYEVAVDFAFEKSMQGHIIVEDFLLADGCSSDSDCFSVNGKLKVVSFNSQRFDANAANPFTPAAFTWPSTMTKEQEIYLTGEIQRLLHLLNMGTTVYNVESRISGGVPYIMEVSPRGGGNRLCESLKHASGIDLITAQVCAAVGDSVEFSIINRTSPFVDYHHHIAYVALHAEKKGKFVGVDINKDFFELHSLEPLDLWVDERENVEAFTGANTTLGTLPLKFDNEQDMLQFISHIDTYVKVRVI